MTGLDFDERFGLLVDAEWLDRQNKRLARNLREAKLRLNDACIEGIDYPARRKLDKAVIRGLASCTWIHEHHNVVITRPTGVAPLRSRSPKRPIRMERNKRSRSAKCALETNTFVSATMRVIHHAPERFCRRRKLR